MGGALKLQQYFCTECLYAGSVKYKEHDPVFEVMARIEKDHAWERSRVCDKGLRGIRVRNVQLCDDKCWALVIAAGQAKPSPDELRKALEESVTLQSHYATLLNQHDGGERLTFKTAEEWINRLRDVRGDGA